MKQFEGQCELLNGIFFSLLNEVITDLVPYVQPNLPAINDGSHRPFAEDVGKPRDEKIHPSVKFVYYGNRSQCTNHQGVITIASWVDEIDGNRAYYGVSYCAPSDVYDKQKGKRIAFDRLRSGDNSVGFDKKNHRELNTRILASIFAGNQYPSWAKDTIDYEAYSLLCNF